MATEGQIRELAYSLWEQEGRPEGRDQEHYFRAKKRLEDQEVTSASEAPPQLGSAKARRGAKKQVK